MVAMLANNDTDSKSSVPQRAAIALSVLGCCVVVCRSSLFRSVSALAKHNGARCGPAACILHTLHKGIDRLKASLCQDRRPFYDFSVDDCASV